MNRSINVLREHSKYLEKGIRFFHTTWGNDKNFNFYEDCILHSLSDASALPAFYLMIEDDEIIASYALLTNDLISRQDLWPWLACLFVISSHRGQGIARQLLDHAINECKHKGFPYVYLSTDLDGFYEHLDWDHYTDGFNPFGEQYKIYRKKTP